MFCNGCNNSSLWLIILIIILFGCGCGLITMLIRTAPTGAYPEGVSFSILIMNALTPLINRFTQPKPFGKVKK